ncbi:hypothetical protein EVAR_52624_1 [Eumeta japonica]|uniref:Uncharacterized protein n=1 Tax=Eumeta variegata TaxID=151549 RepID=A0A4C1XZ84_EUMVA|nr:hypothetical protein EVAR_52624_1 [Eumeta japonica]
MITLKQFHIDARNARPGPSGPRERDEFIVLSCASSSQKDPLRPIDFYAEIKLKMYHQKRAAHRYTRPVGRAHVDPDPTPVLLSFEHTSGAPHAAEEKSVRCCGESRGAETARDRGMGGREWGMGRVAK